MKISVVMTTFNGGLYIEQQLQSLRCQSRSADEVLILDDASIDNTVTIIKKFIEKYKLKTWNLEINSNNLGWKRNFIRGFIKSTGDLIFPCDQDDIWYSDKLEVMADIMEGNPRIELLVGDCMPIMHKKNIFSTILRLRTHSYKKKIKRQFFDNRYRNVKQGCRMCFRRELWEKTKEFWFPELAHDRLLSYYAKLFGTYYDLYYPVIQYRYHTGSASNPKEKNKNVRIGSLEIDKMELESLEKNWNFADKEKKVLQNAKKWNSKRMELVKNRNIKSGICLIRYLSFYPVKRHYISDWLYALSKQKYYDFYI